MPKFQTTLIKLKKIWTLEWVTPVVVYESVHFSGLFSMDNFFSENFDEANEENVAQETARIFGTEHPWFWRIHITALCSLSQ